MDDHEPRRDADVVRQLDQLMAGRISRREALRRLGILGLSLPVASSLVAACASGGGGSSVASTKSKAVIGIVQEPTALDPTAAATASIYVLLRDNLYEGLVRLDQTGKIVPQLARSWDVSQDGKTFTFHLQQGVKFHDGTPFSAQDVKFSFDRAKDPSTRPANPHADYFAPVDSITVVDDHTVKVALSTYSDNWLFHMTAGAAIVVSQKSAATNATNPTGTGPFRFGAWNRGASLTLNRNDDYWGSKPKIKDVEFRFITDANAMNNALTAGDIDAIGQVGGPEQVQAFASNQSFRVLKGQPSGKIMVSINNTSGPLADKRVRQAIYAAIDRKAWIDGVLAGYAVPIGSHSVPSAAEPYYTDETAVNAFDVGKAKQLLSSAAQPALTLRLAQITDFPYAVRGTDILNSQLKAAGVTLQVVPMQFARWITDVFGGAQNYDLTIINHAENRDIGNYGNSKYYWHVNNPALASQLKQADAEPDAGKRKSLYSDIQKTLAENAYNAWIMSGNVLGVTKHNLHGYSLQGIAPSLYVGDLYFT